VLYPNQAFRVGARAYGFQFHVEVDRALAVAWAEHLPPTVSLDERRRSDVEQAGRKIIQRFFDLALGGKAAIA
jgi:GMP synthase-like glutamine amidotransferase